MIALIDYGAGNVRSVHKALETVGAKVTLASEPGPLLNAAKIVLPGVGAFGDCISSLHRAGLVDALLQAVERGTPLLGICVGMQVLFEEGARHPARARDPLSRQHRVGGAKNPPHRLESDKTEWNESVTREPGGRCMGVL